MEAHGPVSLKVSRERKLSPRTGFRLLTAPTPTQSTLAAHATLLLWMIQALRSPGRTGPRAAREVMSKTNLGPLVGHSLPNFDDLSCLTCADGPTKAWRLSGKIKGDKIFVDFSPKGGPKVIDLYKFWQSYNQHDDALQEPLVRLC